MVTRAEMRHAFAMRDFLANSPMVRNVAAVLLFGPLALASAAPPDSSSATAAAVVPRSPELTREVETWRVCARLNLPSDFRRVKDSAAAVALALEKCRRQRYVVAGQYALDYPGTVRTQSFVDGVSIELVEELSIWLENVDANRISPHPPVPRSPRKH